MPRTRKTSTKAKTPKNTATEKDAVVSETAPSETDAPNSAETLKETLAPTAQEAQDKGTTAEEPAGPAPTTMTSAEAEALDWAAAWVTRASLLGTSGTAGVVIGITVGTVMQAPHWAEPVPTVPRRPTPP